MRYLPLFADLKHRSCLVVGGGVVAERRVAQLLEAGARVTVMAPSLTDALLAKVAAGRIVYEAAHFNDQSFDDYWLIVAATDDDRVNRRVAAAAENDKRLCNVVDSPELCTFIMPAIIERDPITIAISSNGTSPTLARWLKGTIEKAVPARLGELALLARRWRDRVKAKLPDLDSRRHFWASILTGIVADESLAGNDEASERALDTALAEWQGAKSGKPVGQAYLVGAGPGDPELLTLRGHQLLANADVVLYDRLVNPKILEYARRDAEKISVGKTAGVPSIKQAQLNRLLVSLVSSGKRVCRLKGGDPMIFGRAGEELEALKQAGLPFQIVPGVSALEGCAAYAGIPLTLRGSAQAILITTGHTHDHVSADLSTYQRGQTLALYMAVAQFEAIAAELVGFGHAPETPVAVIENGTTEAQRVIRTSLGDLAAVSARLKVRSPALLLVGDTVRYAERYSWFKPGGLNSEGSETTRELAQVS